MHIEERNDSNPLQTCPLQSFEWKSWAAQGVDHRDQLAAGALVHPLGLELDRAGSRAHPAKLHGIAPSLSIYQSVLESQLPHKTVN